MQAPEPLRQCVEAFFANLFSEIDPEKLDPLIAMKMTPTLVAAAEMAYTMGFADGQTAQKADDRRQ